MKDKVIVVFGPTGTAGSGAVEACLDDPGVAEVRAITRRPLGISNDKLVEVLCTSFADLSPIAHHLRDMDTCLFCLGTSARNVKGADEYREIHVTYALEAARHLLAESPEASFVYLSGAGANRKSRMMWARVKAEAEDQLGTLGLARHVNVRPGAILPMKPTGASRWLMAPLLLIVPSFGIGAKELGEAMLKIGLESHLAEDGATLENRDLRKLVIP